MGPREGHAMVEFYASAMMVGGTVGTGLLAGWVCRPIRRGAEARLTAAALE